MGGIGLEQPVESGLGPETNRLDKSLPPRAIRDSGRELNLTFVREGRPDVSSYGIHWHVR